MSLAASLAASLTAAGSARANPAGSVPSSDRPDERIDLGADYEYDASSARITREQNGNPDLDPLAELPRQLQLESHQARQLFTPSATAGIYHDLWVSLAVPIVLAQSSELDVPSGANRAAISTFSDGILPANGFDAGNPDVPPGGNVAFRDIGRSGIPELRIGIGYAPMNQALDDTVPTWKIGVDLHLAVGRVMRFDAVNPDRETGVSTGIDELRLWTSLDRRYRSLESWFEMSWQTPIYTRSASLFQDPGFGASKIGPSQTAGVSFGGEAYVLDDPASGKRISVELGARITAHLDGRGYSEMWQAFAFAGDSRTAGPLILDADPTTPGLQPLSHPGITNIESYLDGQLRVAVRGKLAPRLTIVAFGELGFATEHIITFADAGVDLPTCPTDAPRCETGDNTQVTPGTQEVNPIYAPLIDLVGHRYHVEGSRSYTAGLSARLSF